MRGELAATRWEVEAAQEVARSMEGAVAAATDSAQDISLQVGLRSPGWFKVARPWSRSHLALTSMP